jgi:hypothetical protein
MKKFGKVISYRLNFQEILSFFEKVEVAIGWIESPSGDFSIHSWNE